MPTLPEELYTVKSIVALEQVAINEFDVPAYELMKRAGQAVFNLIQARYASCKRILVICGAGNNAGDGYVVAKLAQQAGFDVNVISLIDPQKLHGAAGQAYHDWLDIGSNSMTDVSMLDDADLIIDAMLGTGLARDLDDAWSGWIYAINEKQADRNVPVIAVDIPSGLYADTGAVSNATAVRADLTMTFIGLKQGLFTAEAGDYCGEIQLDRLGLPEDAYTRVVPDARLLKKFNSDLIRPRDLASNKGNFGHVLIVGGNRHMPGALILSASAALRAGAGKVTVLTIAQHIAVIAAAVPEAMILTCDDQPESVEDILSPSFLSAIDYIAIGMGLGRDPWAMNVLQFCIAQNKPMLIDADALNLIAEHKLKLTYPVIITPHPGEAGRLTGVRVQQDRFSAVRQLHSMLPTGSVVVLKGFGSLIFDGDTLAVCAAGNPAMATAGMGDVLSGIITGILSQREAMGLDMYQVAELAVCLHASIADKLAGEHSRGLLASDVVNALVENLP